MDTKLVQINVGTETASAIGIPPLKYYNTLLLMFFLLAIQACALSPQSITLNPVLNVAVPTQAQTRTITLQVLDLRSNKAFGTRGGVYDTALITPRLEVAQALYRALAERLQSANFQISDTDSTTLPRLEIRIERIDYGLTPVIAGGLLNEIKVNALIRATVLNDNRVLSGQYQATSARRLNAYPSAQKNETLLNEVIGKALQSLLADQELIALLSN